MVETECVILAAGKGTRLGLVDRPKVMADIGGRPLLHHTVETVFKLNLDKIVIVTGHMGDVVRNYFGRDCDYAEQKILNGNAGALNEGCSVVNEATKNLLVLQGDDSAFYRDETLRSAILLHDNSDADLTLLLTNDYSPLTFGTQYKKQRFDRVTDLLYPVKDPRIGNFPTGSFVVKKEVVERVISELSEINGVLSTTQIVKQLLDERKLVVSLTVPSTEWYGINTSAELAAGNNLMSQLRNQKFA